MLQTLNFTPKRKRFPLLNLSLPANFLLPDGDFQLEVQQVSNEEFRVACAAGDIPRLVPRTAHHQPETKILHQVVLSLAADLQLKVSAQVKLCRRYSQEAFNVTLQFVGLTNNQQQQLEDFLGAAMAKDAPVACMLG